MSVEDNLKENKYALALKKELDPESVLIPLDRKVELNNVDVMILQKHLEGWSVKKIADSFGYTRDHVYRSLRKEDSREIVQKNRDFVYDELQALGEKVVTVLREGLDSKNESTRIKCALGLVGRLSKPKDQQGIDDSMTARKFLQQININNLYTGEDKAPKIKVVEPKEKNDSSDVSN